MSNSLDPDQDRHSVGPDLGLNSLQRLSTVEQMTKISASKERVKLLSLADNQCKQFGTSSVGPCVEILAPVCIFE